MLPRNRSEKIDALNDPMSKKGGSQGKIVYQHLANFHIVKHV